MWPLKYENEAEGNCTNWQLVNYADSISFALILQYPRDISVMTSSEEYKLLALGRLMGVSVQFNSWSRSKRTAMLPTVKLGNIHQLNEMLDN